MSFDSGYYGEIERQEKSGKRKPKVGQTYTTKEIETELALADSPFLTFRWDGVKGVINSGHITREQLLSVPGLAERRWIYRYTTVEWIPIFLYVDENPIIDVLDLLKIKIHDGKSDSWWATPKGFPREYESF